MGYVKESSLVVENKARPLYVDVMAGPLNIYGWYIRVKLLDLIAALILD